MVGTATREGSERTEGGEGEEETEEDVRFAGVVERESGAG